jgi:pyruvate kinase
VPILALTPSLATSRRLCVMSGAHSVRTDEVGSSEEMAAKACHHAQDEGFAKPRDIIVTAAGIAFHAAGNTNSIRLIQI